MKFSGFNEFFRKRIFLKRFFFKQEGFSLIELMVVVAIIGILAAIGIPQYAKFQAKARQSEAKGALSALFTAETSFYAEWSQYSKDLKNIGFGVQGTRLRYITGFAKGACLNYTTAGGAPTESTGVSNTWSCGGNINVTSATQATGWMLPSGFVTASMQSTSMCGIPDVDPVFPVTGATTSSCNATTGTQTFTGVSIGDPNTNIGSLFLDGWTMTQAKAISNSSPGIQ